MIPVLLFLLFFPTPVRAQTPTPVAGGIPNEPLPIAGSSSEIDDGAVELKFTAGMGSNLQIPDFTLPSTLFSGAIPYLYPLNLQDAIVKPTQTPEYSISGKTALCIKIPGVTTIRIQTSGLPYKLAAPKLAQTIFGAFGLSFLGHETISPNEDGKFDFQPNPQEQAAIPLCSDTTKGTEQKGEQTISTQSYTPMSLVQRVLRSLLSGVSSTFASNTFVPYGRETEGAITNIAKTYVPPGIDATDGKTHGTIVNPLVAGGAVKMNFEKTAALDASTKTVLCSLIPRSNRANVGITDEDCKRQERHACGDIPDLTISDQSCKLCNPDDISAISATFFPSGIPETMVKILEKAGDAYHVPPKMLLLTLFSESGHPTYLEGETWTEENIREWSFCGQTMPFCTPETATALVPFGIKPSVFEQYKTAVSDIYPERKGQENPCNFLAQAFAAAKILSDNMNTRLPTTISAVSGGTCLGVPVTQLSKTRSATSCSWSELDMYRGRLMYLRYCPESGKTGGFSPNDQTLNWTRLFSSSFSCQ